MRKKIIFIFIAVLTVGFLFCGTYLFSTRRIRTINNYWTMDIPYSVRLIDVDSFFAMGEGFNYYVVDLNGYDLENDRIFDREPDSDVNAQERYESLVKEYDINDTAVIDWSEDYLWTELKSDDRHLLIIVFDDNTKAVFIGVTGIFFDAY